MLAERFPVLSREGKLERSGSSITRSRHYQCTPMIRWYCIEGICKEHKRAVAIDDPHQTATPEPPLCIHCSRPHLTKYEREDNYTSFPENKHTLLNRVRKLPKSEKTPHGILHDDPNGK